MTSLVVALMAGAGLLSGISSFKESKLQQKAASSQEVAGKAAVGGPFVLIDMNGKPFSNQDLLGKFYSYYIYLLLSHLNDGPDALQLSIC